MAEAPQNRSTTPMPRHWDPFAAFRAETDRLFDTFFSGGGLPSHGRLPSLIGSTTPSMAAGGFMEPSVDVKETDSALVVSAELPGMDEKDIDLQVHDGRLTLKGEKKHEHDEEKDQVHVVERRYGAFQRSFSLPDTVDADKVEAHFDKGVLTVTLPKRPDAPNTARRVSIGRR